MNTIEALRQDILQYLQDVHPENVELTEIAASLGRTKTVVRAAAEQMVKDGTIKGRMIGSNFRMSALSGNDSPTTEPTPEPEPATTKAIKRTKPFTPNPTRGYEVQKGKVKIYLDRRAASRVLTLTVDDLRELTRAVEKSKG